MAVQACLSSDSPRSTWIPIPPTLVLTQDSKSSLSARVKALRLGEILKYLRNSFIASLIALAIAAGSAAAAPAKDKWVYGGINPQLTRAEPKAKPKTKISPSSVLAPIETCRIAQGDSDLRNFSSGFPIKPERMTLSASTKVAVLAVDFQDLRAKSNPRKDLADALSAMNSYYRSSSTKPVSFDFITPSTYFNLPRSVADYGLGGDFFAGGFDQKKQENYWSYVRAAIAVADPTVDFTGVKTIIVAGPPNITNAQIGVFVAQAATSDQAFQTAEGPVANVLIRGNDQVRDLANWTHEMGHMLGLTDIRDTRNLGAQKSDGMGAFDLMANYTVPELTVWHRFLLGIVNDNQIRCVTQEAASVHWIRPVAEKTAGVKGVVIPLGPYEALVVESRRSLGYDTRLFKSQEGALVYSLDTRIKYRQSPMKIIPPARSVDRFNELDSTLRKSESVSFRNWKVSVLESGVFGDVVRIERVQ
jgi:M6 family metalloprotease-like protein